MTEQLSTNNSAAQKYVPPNLEERQKDNVEKPQIDYNNTQIASFDDLDLKDNLFERCICQRVMRDPVLFSKPPSCGAS